MVTTRPPKTIVKPTALGPVANTDTKLLIYGLFQKGRVLAQDGVVVPNAVHSGANGTLLVKGRHRVHVPSRVALASAMLGRASRRNGRER